MSAGIKCNFGTALAPWQGGFIGDSWDSKASFEKGYTERKKLLWINWRYLEAVYVLNSDPLTKVYKDL